VLEMAVALQAVSVYDLAYGRGLCTSRSEGLETSGPYLGRSPKSGPTLYQRDKFADVVG